MSRLDWFTIAVVGICILAIIFLLAKTTSLLAGEQNLPSTRSEIVDEMGLNDDDTIDPANFDSETATGEADSDDGEAIASGSGDSETGGGDGGDDDESDAEEAATADDTDGDSDSGSGDDGSAAASRNVAPAPAGSGDFMVIAGSFSVMENAEKFANDLQRKGYGKTQVHKFNKGKFASVIVDRFDDNASAADLIKELKGKGVDCYLQRRKGNN